MKTICILKDCELPMHAKGYCSIHVQRMKKYGDPYMIVRNVGNNVTKHPLYKVYMDMKQRCYNSGSPGYSNWGGRGIIVCEKWLGLYGFNEFVKDMGTRPEGYTLDRINNDGNYEPDNCRWASKKEQVINRRMFKKNKSGYTGVYFHKRDKAWYASICNDYKLIHLGKFKVIDDAIKARREAEVIYRGVLI
jgi:hypothetical protein